MKNKYLIIISIICLIVLLVSCDGTVLRDVVDSVPTVGTKILDYIKDGYFLTEEGVMKDGQIVLEADKLRSVSKSGDTWFCLSSDGKLSFGGNFNDLTHLADGVSVLTQSGFWVEKNNTVHFGADKNKKVSVNSIACVFESNGKIIVQAGDTLTVYDKNLEQKAFTDSRKGPVCGFISIDDNYYYLTHNAIYDIEGNEIITYSSVDNINVCFAYKYEDSVRLVYQYNSNSKSYFGIYDIEQEKQNYQKLSNLNGLAILEYIADEDEDLIVTSKNGVFKVAYDEEGFPVAEKKEI